MVRNVYAYVLFLLMGFSLQGCALPEQEKEEICVFRGWTYVHNKEEGYALFPSCDGKDILYVPLLDGKDPSLKALGDFCIWYSTSADGSTIEAEYNGRTVRGVVPNDVDRICTQCRARLRPGEDNYAFGAYLSRNICLLCVSKLVRNYLKKVERLDKLLSSGLENHDIPNHLRHLLVSFLPLHNQGQFFCCFREKKLFTQFLAGERSYTLPYEELIRQRKNREWILDHYRLRTVVLALERTFKILYPPPGLPLGHLGPVNFQYLLLHVLSNSLVLAIYMVFFFSHVLPWLFEKAFFARKIFDKRPILRYMPTAFLVSSLCILLHATIFFFMYAVIWSVAFPAVQATKEGVWLSFCSLFTQKAYGIVFLQYWVGILLISLSFLYEKRSLPFNLNSIRFVSAGTFRFLILSSWIAHASFQVFSSVG